MCSNAELELKLLKGSTIVVDGIKIKPLTLAYIVDDLGFDKYIQTLSILGFDKSKFKEDIPEYEYNKLLNYDLYISHEQLINSLLEFLKTFLNYDEIFFVPDNQSFAFVSGGELAFLNRDNSDKVIEIFRKMYNINIEKEPEYNPANDRARAIIEKIKKKNEVYANLHKEEDVDLNSIISGVAWKSTNTNIFNVFDLTIYQLYDAYYRLEIVDNYNNTMTGLYSGNIDGKTLNPKKISWIKKYISNT